MVDPAILRGFSGPNPNECFSEELLAHVVREYALSLLSLAADRCADSFEIDCLSTLLDQPSTIGHNSVWSPALGHCFVGLESGNTTLMQRGIVQTMLNLLCDGFAGHLQINLAEPISFCLAPFLLPASHRLEARGDGQELWVRLDGATHVFDLVSKGKVGGTRQNVGEEVVAHLNVGNSQILILSIDQVDKLQLVHPPFPPLQKITAGQLSQISECVAFLETRLPHYRAWIERVLTHLLLVKSPPNRLYSGNVGRYCGLAYISDVADILKNAEMLIHESSHHYFNLLTYLGDLIADNERLHYSPFVRTHRPPDRILLAYHAFANVETFYQECIQQGFRISQCQRALANLTQDVEFVERVLSNEVEFTRLGSCVFEPIVTRRASYVHAN